MIYGFWGERNNMINSASVSGDAGALTGDPICNGTGEECTVTGSRTTEWGAGFVQEIDAVAMSMWVQAEHFDAKASGCTDGVDSSGACVIPTDGDPTVAHSDFKGMTVVKFGGLHQLLIAAERLSLSNFNRPGKPGRFFLARCGCGSPAFVV